MKDEIYSGLKNSIERGFSLEESIQSFINAGYNPQEVREAGKMLSTGVSDIVFQNPSPQQKENNLLPPLPQEDLGVQKKKNKILIILIIISGLIFLGAIGFLVYVLLTRK